MNLNFYQISTEFQALEEMLLADQGELSETSEELQAYVQGLITEKTDNMVGFINKLDDEIELAQKHIKRLQEYKKARENAIERLKEYCRFCMDRLGTDKVVGQMASIKIAKPVASVEVIDESALPFELVETTVKPRKAEIAKLLKAGEEVPGAALAYGKPSVRFNFKSVGE